MKNIFILLVWSYAGFCGAMESEHNNTKKSFSPGPTRKQISQHARHRSLSGKVLDMLHLRTDEIKPLPLNIEALVSDRKSPESPKETVKDSPKKTKSAKSFTPSNSRNDSPRKLESARDRYSNALTGARVALAGIKTWEDCHYILKCRQYLNNARSYSMQLIVQEIPEANEQWLEKRADEDEHINSLKKELDEKIASLGAQKK